MDKVIFKIIAAGTIEYIDYGETYTRRLNSEQIYLMLHYTTVKTANGICYINRTDFYTIMDLSDML